MAILLESAPQLRRLNLSGAGKQKHEHSSILVAHYLMQEHGLHRALSALSVFRNEVSGVMSPTEGFDKPLWKF